MIVEILNDMPSLFYDCRVTEVLNLLPIANDGTIELLYMQVCKDI